MEGLVSQGARRAVNLRAGISASEWGSAFYNKLSKGDAMMNTPAPRLLTKSLFKMALECPTKLYYSDAKRGYADKNADNDFLQALADGGHQIGELAKYKYHPDPVGGGITVSSLVRAEAVAQTHAKLSEPGRVVVAEAALLSEPYFIRVDILIRDEARRVVEVIEVKSKSISDDVVSSGFKGARGGFIPEWVPYLYDIAFQTSVAELAFPGYTVVPKLLLIDSAAVCDVDGLHQLFSIVSKEVDGRQRTVVESPAGLTKAQLGSLGFLREIAVGDVVHELQQIQLLHARHVPNEFALGMKQFMPWAAKLLANGERSFLRVSKTCRSCQFRASDPAAEKSGVHECWELARSQGLIQGVPLQGPMHSPLSIDLWGGSAGAKSYADDVLNKSRAYLSDIQEDDIRPKTDKPLVGMSAFERRMAQVNAAQHPRSPPVLFEDRLSDMDDWEWPLHMIDFETSAPAIPFFAGMRPYETLAFQFSHHVMDKRADGTLHIRHASQWISTAAAAFPSIEFVRQLRQALMPDGVLHGTVFRYHNHENTVLRSLRKVIVAQPSKQMPDQADLLAFIDLITKSTGNEAKDDGEHCGAKPMVDLHQLVQKGYFSKHMQGSISLKYVLPAVLKDAPGVAQIYSQPGVYGKGLAIESLNFDQSAGHQWLHADKGGDPYKTLPPIFESNHAELNAMLLKLAGDADEEGTIAQGGLAMTAYNFTQFASLTGHERQRIGDALLRYCELDTLAMVMLVQGLLELRGLSMPVHTGV
jgi:hypothetical protein